MSQNHRQFHLGIGVIVSEIGSISALIFVNCRFYFCFSFIFFVVPSF